MKNKYKVMMLSALLCSVVTYSCKEEFLEREPLGAIAETSLANAAGVNGALIQAYRTLRGQNVGNWYTSPMNWVWGGVRSDEAYKGTEISDQNQLNPIERYETLPNNGSVLAKWNACYDGVGMANTTLQLLAKATDMSAADKTKVEAEARFIRAFHHFEVKRTFDKVPFVDEKAVTTADFRAIKNDTDIYPKIEEDFQFAFDNLPATQAQIGRVNKWAAGAFLAKAYLYQKKYGQAKTLFDDLIANGVTSKGDKYGLIDRFSNVFRGEYENSKEVIFGVQVTVGDGTGGENSNKDGELTNPHNNGPVGCCGFYQPSQSLANSFKTSGGLPLANPHASNVIQQENGPNSFPDRGEFDPRIDWSIGRIGIQYLDWGVAEASWIRRASEGGPFLPIKNIHTKAEVGSFQIPGSWGQGQSGRNILVIRYADLLLMAAECEVEAGSLEKAREYVNMIRSRAANANDFVKKNGVNEANYSISLYSSVWTDKTVATNAVRTERLLELAMEGHRFYDLVRWGIAQSVLNDYVARESGARTHLKDAIFSAEDNYLPIPEYVIAQSGGNIKP
jgi:starch-binding outer membrane protein, SusD/RagB family